MQNRDFTKVVVASSVGTLFEWYDFLIFATAAALVFGKLFFAASDPMAVSMAALLTFAVGYFARPVGALVFGHIGDRWGRRPALYMTMAIMGAATFAIGLLPTYESIGIWAPVGLVALRIIQGMAFGGEWGGACLMITEHAPPQNRSLLTSLIQLGYPVGVLLASGSFALLAALPEQEFLAWGWRVPFLTSVLLTAVGAYVRWRLEETPVWHDLQKRRELSSQPVIDTVRTHWRTIAQGVALKVTEVSWAYLLTVYFVMYAVANMNMTRPEVMTSVLIASAVNVFMIPVFGWLADQIGHRKLYQLGAVASLLIALPIWLLLDGGFLTMAMILGLVVGNAIMMAPLGACLSALFPDPVRYTGVSISNQIAAAVGGGVMPLLASATVNTAQALWPVGALLMVLSVATLWAARSLR